MKNAIILTVHALTLGLTSLAVGCSGAPAPGEGAESTSSADGVATTGEFLSFGGAFGLNRCLDIQQGVLSAGNRLDSWSCNGTPAQSFGYWGDSTIRPSADVDLCLDVQGGSVSGGAVQLWYCNGTPGQIWQYNNGQLHSGLSNGYCLDVLDGNQGNNATVDLAPCNNTAAQVWWPAGFSAVMTNYEHMNVNPVYGNYQAGCLDVSNDNTQAGSSMDSWVCNQSDAQLFTLTAQHQITFHGLCLDVFDANVPLGLLHMEACNGTGAQLWDFAPGSNGLMTIQNSLTVAFDGPYCLDIHGNSAFSGTTVDLAGCNGTTAQSWQPVLRQY